MATQVKLGQQVRCKASGVTGFAYQMNQSLFGMPQVAIQPMGDGNSLPEAIYIDLALIEVLGEGMLETGSFPEPTFKEGLVLGATAIDEVTGIVGTIISKAVFINGCVFYEIQPRSKKRNNKKVESLYTNQHRLSVVADAPFWTKHHEDAFGDKESFNKEGVKAVANSGGPMKRGAIGKQSVIKG
jgi:hypothetical protein